MLLLTRAMVGVPAVVDEPAAAKVNSIFAPLVDARSPGVAVLVRKNGRTIFQRGYGVRDLRTFAKIDARTDFRLASFTKQFTAMATMLLVKDGKLRYDETLTDLFPDFPAYGRTITIRHLLTHTSGLPDYEDVMEKVEKAKGPIWTPTHQIQDAGGARPSETAIRRKIQAGHELGLQQLGLRAARAHCRKGIRTIVRSLLARLGSSNRCT